MSVILLIVGLFFQPQDTSPEQVAFDSFIRNQLESYADHGSMFFSGITEPKANLSGPFHDCFPSDEQFNEFFHKEKPRSVDQKEIEFTETKRLKKSSKSKKNKLNLEVYGAVYDREVAYVHLVVYEPSSFADHYLFKLSLSKSNVIETCKRSEMM
ncbi:MAG: hypothetical protein COW03_18190 [Cytophagales bacterium CG12_big_fil_rev_8_21_14_0_65_40_12]|nr:MAG: hypothetical protein COW03_18190 [Cytophagales bacterium CG12_big_fil_rev_8_21_14_0_65_40_12]PIW04749.1 MAG: hypothetical protein COW40_07730 [Cytophagales bacterium CG17_big_fil_post_rev_8_21_14_2_50_40_13]